MFGVVPTLQNEPTGQPVSWLHSLRWGVGFGVGAFVGVGVGLGVGEAVGDGVGDGVGRTTHATCPVMPRV